MDREKCPPGWTYGDSNRFYHESLQGHPESPAWDEPGYRDPEESHAGLPVGTRYWQVEPPPKRPLWRRLLGLGPARKKERALDPGFVARAYGNGPRTAPPGGDQARRARERLIRETEQDRLNIWPTETWPG